MHLPRRLAAVAVLSLMILSVSYADAPKVGDPAPDIALKATQIQKVMPDLKGDTMSLKDLRGKHVVLFWYPKALTKGCTIESCGFRDLIPEFEKANAVVVGFSPDTLEKQQEFTEKEKLNFPLFADPDKKLYKALDVKKRSTWVINKEGEIVKFYDTVSVDKHPKEVLQFVKTLK